MSEVAALPGPGTYVVAVSGGVDSMTLLDMLARTRQDDKTKFIIAHYDHGIRPDSGEDRVFVQKTAAMYKMPFVFDVGNLGQYASEAEARAARYKFLKHVKKIAGAEGIITAHHQDDMLETAVINMLRGTGRRGLTALKSTSELIRPMLHMPKQEILAYANEYKVQWREDSTNSDTKYLRNYVRHKILSKFSNDDRRQFVEHLNNLAKLNQDIDGLLVNHLHIHPAVGVLDRHWFIMLPHSVAAEVIASWLRIHEVKDVNKKTIEKLIHGAKTLSAGKELHVDKSWRMIVKKDNLALKAHER